MHTSGNTYCKLIVYGILFITLSGCGLPPPNLQQLAPISRDNICRVAILPFNNETSYNQGDIIIYRVFAAELSRVGNFMIAQEGDVRNVLRQLKALPGEDFNVEQLRILADRLKVQLLISGSIIEMDENVRSGQADPSLAIIYRIIDAESGAVLWVTYHRREGRQYRKVMHFGVISTVTELVRRVSQEVVEHWFTVGGLQQCTE